MVLLGVIINNWGHIIAFGGRGFIGGDFYYLGARLLATCRKGCLHQRRIFDSGAERSHSTLKGYIYIIHLHHKSFAYLLVLQSSIMKLTKKKFV